MRSPEQLRPKHADSQFQIREKIEGDWQFNREMYLRVGEQWRWIDKRPWTDQQWKEYASEVRTFAAYFDDELAGYYELRAEAEMRAGPALDGRRGVEIAYFGLLPEFVGRALGGGLLTSAIEEAWRMSPTPARVWVHTCNRDHPQALANYQARGLVIYKVEEG